MAARKVSATNVIKLSGTTTVLSLGVGASGSFLLSNWYPNISVSTCMTWAWIVPHFYILVAAVDTLREELGFRSPARIVGNWGKRTFGRRIPVNAGDKSTDIFMQVLPFTTTKNQDVVELETITVWYNDTSYTITIPELEEFLYVAWRRQSQEKSPFSRDYWTRQRRPRLKTLEYNLRMTVLISVDGLVIDRGERRSGKLTLEPRTALERVQNAV